uniref:Uncharacterized protein n=1 Tax=Rangifer tarandus platyrhynchus TaxID=3082113 RepID=A0ACB0F358_RANTA|nr:unnamed protein product [Rangifer tarandus platyrhynchus]
MSMAPTKVADGWSVNADRGIAKPGNVWTLGFSTWVALPSTTLPLGEEGQQRAPHCLLVTAEEATAQHNKAGSCPGLHQQHGVPVHSGFPACR